MKNLIFLFIFIPIISFAQIQISEKVENEKVGEIKILNSFLMELEYNLENENYIFLFRDLSFQEIIVIKSFTISKSDIDLFYKTIINDISNKEKKELEVKLNNGNKLTLNFEKKKVQFLLWDGVSLSQSQYFSEKQIMKLFNR